MNKKALGITAIIATLSITLTGILIIMKVLPFNLIGGGRMPDYKSAVILTLFSLVIQLLIIFCTLVSSEIIKLPKLKMGSNIVLIFFTAYFALNIVMNLLGKTWFEKIYCSLVCVVQIICFILILKSNKN